MYIYMVFGYANLAYHNPPSATQVDQKKEFEKEEKRCRVREKELREKDILIQDNLIRFSSFLSTQDTRKNKDLEAAELERAKIIEKDREIEQAEARLKAL